MNSGRWAWLLCAAIAFLAGCAGFWQKPNSASTSYTLTSGGNISVSPGATTGNTSLITVTPANSFTGTVTLACTIASSPSGASSPVTCSLSPTSVSITNSSAQTATLTATTTPSTTTGAYQITVTGTSGSLSESIAVCAEVSTTSATCTAASGASAVFYVLNQTTSQVVALSISSGALNPIGSVTLPVPAPLAIAVAPNGKFLYVSTTSGIFLYTIGSNGALTAGNNSLTVSADEANTIEVDATNSWLVDGVTGLGQLSALAINPSTGLPAVSGESEQLFTGGLPVTTITQLAISPTDSSSCTSCYVFVAMGSGGTEEVHFNPGNANPFGSAGHTNVVNSGGGANTVAVDPTNRLFYVGETDALSGTQTGGVRAFSIASGNVAELSASPYSTQGTGPTSIVPSADGNYLYVGNQTVSGSADGNIASFSVSTTALTSIGTVAAGPAGRLSLTEDSTGTYLIATDFAGSPDIEAYTMSSGVLTSSATSTFSNDPVGAIAIAALP